MAVLAGGRAGRWPVAVLAVLAVLAGPPGAEHCAMQHEGLAVLGIVQRSMGEGGPCAGRAGQGSPHKQFLFSKNSLQAKRLRPYIARTWHRPNRLNGHRVSGRGITQPCSVHCR